MAPNLMFLWELVDARACSLLSRALSHIISYFKPSRRTVQRNNVFLKSKNWLEYLSIFSLKYWISVSLSGFCGKGVIVFSMCYNSIRLLNNVFPPSYLGPWQLLLISIIVSIILKISVSMHYWPFILEILQIPFPKINACYLGVKAGLFLQLFIFPQ